MEPITHILFGAALGHALAERRTPYAALTLALSAELPDIDAVMYGFGPACGLEHHRGYTHSFIASPLMALLTVALVYVWHRLRRHSGSPRWGLLWMLALVGTLSHILLDFTNSFGVHPWMPWNSRWYAADIIFIVEPLLLLPLLVALLLSRRGPFPARFALLWTLAVWSTFLFHHEKALSTLRSTPMVPRDALTLAAQPYMSRPWRWLGIAETAEGYQLCLVDLSAGTLEALPGLLKGHSSPLVKEAQDTPLGKAYLNWSRYPHYDVSHLRVRFLDARYAYPEFGGRGPAVTFEFDEQGNIIKERPY